MKKSTLIHLRFPFSFFLLPVYLFAVAVSKPTEWVSVVLVFFILHFLVYPASNGYNSYFDRDEGSIGGVKNPPKVSLELYRVSLFLDILGLLIAYFINWQFMLMVLIYGLISKAYSHPMTRLKKRPVLGWLAAGIFQGYFTFLMTVMGILDLGYQGVMTVEYQLPAALSTLLLFGSYPMTQIYQHEEDAKRGDITLSLKLGVFGTFHFTAVMFTLAVAGFFVYFESIADMNTAIVFVIILLPVLIYFLRWYFDARKDLSTVNYEKTMRLNLLSSLLLNIFFLGFWLY